MGDRKDGAPAVQLDRQLSPKSVRGLPAFGDLIQIFGQFHPKDEEVMVRL